MSKCKILVIGSTGVLGTKLLNFCKSKKINIDTICCFNNHKKLLKQQNNLNIQNSYVLNDNNDFSKFVIHLNKNKFDIIYFLDHGAFSLKYADIIIRNNKFSILAIANKEMIISGGPLLINKISKSKNILIPLDSEHFSLQKIKFNNESIKKIYITASGGPFYFNKKLKLDQVSLTQVLNHPKWKMGFNNSIDSSNFINKILEIYELSHIYQIDLKKINFLISKEAYIHSLIVFNDNTISLNSFDNDMLITLVSPLKNYFNFNLNKDSNKYLNNLYLKLEKFDDNRFIINKYLKKLMRLNHIDQIKLLTLNKIAQKLYLNGTISYNQIINFVIKNMDKDNKIIKLYNFQSVLKYIQSIEHDHKNSF
jgi:1-deoxy-D-xylulose-5-phosphate reductoisomerase